MKKPKIVTQSIGTPSMPAYLVFLRGLELGMVEKAGSPPNLWVVYRPGCYTYNGHFTMVRTRTDAINALANKRS